MIFNVFNNRTRKKKKSDSVLESDFSFLRLKVQFYKILIFNPYGNCAFLGLLKTNSLFAYIEFNSFSKFPTNIYLKLDTFGGAYHY